MTNKKTQAYRLFIIIIIFIQLSSVLIIFFK